MKATKEGTTKRGINKKLQNCRNKRIQKKIIRSGLQCERVLVGDRLGEGRVDLTQRIGWVCVCGKGRK